MLRGIHELQVRSAESSGAHAARVTKSGIEVVPVGAGSVRLHRPDHAPDGPLPALLWIHGGGYVLGSASQEDAVCRHFANELGALVAAVDYRLAPAHPFPVPLDDCYEALAWLAVHDDVDTDRVAVGGASAGGGLTAALAILARDRGEISLAHQLLVYPMLDDRTVLRDDLGSYQTRLWKPASNRFGWTSYLGTEPGSDDVSPLAAAGRCEDLTGLPPAWLGVGTNDIFVDEDLTYARRLRDAGVPCDVEIVPGAFHGFDYVCAKAETSRQFLASQVRSLGAAFEV